MKLKTLSSVVLSGALAFLPKLAIADDFMVCARHALEINNPGTKGAALGEEAQFLARSFPAQEEGIGLQARSGIAVVGDQAIFFVESKDESVLVVRGAKITAESSQDNLIISTKGGVTPAFTKMMEQVAKNMENDFADCAARAGQNNTVEPSPFHKRLAKQAQQRMEKRALSYADVLAHKANAKKVLGLDY